MKPVDPRQTKKKGPATKKTTAQDKRGRPLKKLVEDDDVEKELNQSSESPETKGTKGKKEQVDDTEKVSEKSFEMIKGTKGKKGKEQKPVEDKGTATTNNKKGKTQQKEVEQDEKSESSDSTKAPGNRKRRKILKIVRDDKEEKESNKSKKETTTVKKGKTPRTEVEDSEKSDKVESPKSTKNLPEKKRQRKSPKNTPSEEERTEQLEMKISESTSIRGKSQQSKQQTNTELPEPMVDFGPDSDNYEISDDANTSPQGKKGNKKPYNQKSSKSEESSTKSEQEGNQAKQTKSRKRPGKNLEETSETLPQPLRKKINISTSKTANTAEFSEQAELKETTYSPAPPQKTTTKARKQKKPRLLKRRASAIGNTPHQRARTGTPDTPDTPFTPDTPSSPAYRAPRTPGTPATPYPSWVDMDLSGRMRRKDIKLSPRDEKYYAMQDRLLPEPDPKEANERRPIRRRFRPLRYWKGEHFLFARSKKTGDWDLDKLVLMRTPIANQKKRRVPQKKSYKSRRVIRYLCILSVFEKLIYKK